MRCPKCHYLGFEPEPRCKNCGYDFSFSEPEAMAAEQPAADVRAVDEPVTSPTPMRANAERRSRRAAADFDLSDLDLLGGVEAVDRGRPASDLTLESLDLAVGGRADDSVMPRRSSASVAGAALAEREPVIVPRAPVPVVREDAPRRPGHRPVAAGPAPMTADLPLFMKGLPDASEAGGSASEADDEPLIRMPAAPRAPLSVRRATPDTARLRATYGKPTPVTKVASLDLLETIDAAASASSPTSNESDESPAAEPAVRAPLLDHVRAGQRLMAASVDVLLLGVINLAVVWFTLDVCELSARQLLALPALPMVAFFLLLDGGYLVLFTAACGQTLGKMAAGIRVVGTSAEAIISDEVSLGQAAGRALGSMLSLVPLGLGFWLALSGQGRALHDRLAHTRVVQA